MKTKLTFLAATVGCLTVGAAQAATYTSQADFLLTNTADVTEDFSSFADVTSSVTGPVTLSSGFTISSESNDLFVSATGQSTNSSQALGSNFPRSDSLTIDLGGVFTAFGLDIFQNNGGGGQTGSNQDYTVTAFLNDILVDTFTAVVAPNGGSFFGFDDIGLFDEVNISNSNLFEVVDNLVATSEPVAPVPLPASLPLLLGAVGTMAAVRRRKKRS